ncbi:phosphate acyltransferase [Roseburia sp. CAG:309]|nr:phosphate acyltransferase [Roseburia sp. CAG:309]
MGDVPTVAIKDKKDSSLVVAMRLVREGKADALVSAGSTGAVLVGGQLVVGRLKGIKRPPLAPFIPTTKGFSLLIDCGANVDARPEHLVQFAQMGSIYYENVMGKKNPTVALLNIGTEEEKGNQLVKDTKPLMKECKNINYIGSVEARELVSGAADVIVCEAFVGNVVLKFFEGLALTLFGSLKEGLMSSTRTKLGALLVKPALKGLKNQFDTSSQGGAPLLGLKGLVVKAHGNSSSKEIEIALKQCISFKKQKINEKIKESICD